MATDTDATREDATTPPRSGDGSGDGLRADASIASRGESQSTQPDTAPMAWAFLAGAVAFLAAALLLGNELGSFGGDNAEYVLLSRALLRGDGYVSDWYVGPSWPHTQYPPGFPVLLLPFAGDAPERFMEAHLLVALCGGIAVGLFAFLFHRRGLPGPAAALAALAPAMSAWWLRCATDLLSELPFLAFVAGALLALEYPGRGTLPARRLVAAAALAAAAFYVRSSGIALVIPVAAVLLFGPRCGGRAGRFAAVAMLLAVGAWFLRGSLLAVSDAATYGGQLAEGTAAVDLIPQTLRRLFLGYLPGIPSYLVPWSGALHGGTGGAAWFREILGWSLWALSAWGIAARWRGGCRPGALEGFLVLHLIMVAAWPFNDTRFGLPVVVILAAGAAEGLHALLRVATTAGAARAFVTAAALLLCVPNAWRLATRVYPRAFRSTPAVAGVMSTVLLHKPARMAETWDLDDAQFAAQGGHTAAYLAMCDVVRSDPSLPDGPVLATNPRVAALLTGRKAARPEPTLAPGEAPRPATPAEVSAFVRLHGVRLVLADGFNSPHAEAIRTWVASGIDPLSPVLELGPVRVFRVPAR